jgi:Zn finger protein HypA/HybF involved in hydrogenase expression
VTLTLEALPEVTPDQVNRDECRDCKTPRTGWNRHHWLYREWSGKCPDCHANDIRLDFRDKNQEDN